MLQILLFSDIYNKNRKYHGNCKSCDTNEYALTITALISSRETFPADHITEIILVLFIYDVLGTFFHIFIIIIRSRSNIYGVTNFF